MELLADQLKGLADPTRLRVLRLLVHGKLCVCDIMAGLALPQSTVSRHMSFLRKGGWVNASREGKWVYYTLNQDGSALQSDMVDVLLQHLPGLPQADEDWQRLAEHLRTKNKTGACAD